MSGRGDLYALLSEFQDTLTDWRQPAVGSTQVHALGHQGDAAELPEAEDSHTVGVFTLFGLGVAPAGPPSALNPAGSRGLSPRTRPGAFQLLEDLRRPLGEELRCARFGHLDPGECRDVGLTEDTPTVLLGLRGLQSISPLIGPIPQGLPQQS